MTTLDDAKWRTSSYTNSGETCVEVADLATHGLWMVRDSKDRTGTKLVIPRSHWAVFAAGVRTGEFC